MPVQAVTSSPLAVSVPTGGVMRWVPALGVRLEVEEVIAEEEKKRQMILNTELMERNSDGEQ